MPDLLIELFSEEIPARMQAKAADDLKKLVTDGLVEAGLTYASAAAFATPRRLALSVDGLLAASAPVREERRGPKVGAPDQAIAGFLRGVGLTQDQLEIRDDKKGQVYFAVIENPGRPAADIIADVLDATVRNFPWPKSMRWGAGSLRWVRPLHAIVCLLADEGGATVVPLDIDGIVSGDITYGHRFLAPDALRVSGFEDYEAKLKRAHVYLRADERAEMIWNEATNQAFAQGLDVVADQGLLREVAGLVEWPVVLMGTIDDAFLGLPAEVLQTSMREHQKFFSVKDKTGRIVRFVTVANTETRDHGATILAGNQKVLSARLADAKFFWENDLRIAKAGMDPWLDSLGHVTFHNKLGTVKDQIVRITSLARELARRVDADEAQTAEAARIAKADLSSEMVFEFPELQGVMGRYYAQEAGLPDAVAAAAQEHYSPLGPSDDVPSAPVSVAVALAAKLDALAGFWAIDEKPTGSKDPYALRRAALGVIRLVVENAVTLPLTPLLNGAFRRAQADCLLTSYEGDVIPEKGANGAVWDRPLLHSAESWETIEPLSWIADRVGTEELSAFERANAAEALREKVVAGHVAECADLLSFFHDRLKVYLRDQGVRHDVIDACIAMPGADDLALLVKRAKALQATLETDDGENLIQGFKRANNILSQAEVNDGVEYSYGADPKFAEEDAERALFEALKAAEAVIAPAMASEDFGAAMAAMAALRAPVDAFFEAVQVNADSAIVRRNRLNLLGQIRRVCGGVADLTLIKG